MKKFLLGALCALSAASAFSYDCSVLLLDSPTNTILASYHGYSGGYDMCRDELRACNRARRTQTNPNRTRCEKLDRYYSGTGVYLPGGVIVTPGPVNPGPVVTPTLGRIVAEELILDMIQSQGWNDNKIDVGFEAIRLTGISHLMPITQICSTASFQSERARCLVDTLSRTDRFLISDSSAEYMMAACLKADTDSDKRKCFTAGSGRQRFPMLENFLSVCRTSSWNDDAVRCFRQVFRI